MAQRGPQTAPRCDTISPSMTTAAYSLLTIRPDPERIDVLCIGALVRAEEEWTVLFPGAVKLERLGYWTAKERLPAMASSLKSLLEDCDTLQQARAYLDNMRSLVSIHEFEGAFAFDTEDDFQRHIRLITSESINIADRVISAPPPPAPRRSRPMVRARLRRQFKEMGILAESGDVNADHKVVPDFPISLKHGLKAEFAIKNTVMHITETVDFDVNEEGFRAKNFEAQAKCLVMRAATDQFGPKTKRYIVIHGGGSDHASRSVDLLSTVGTLFAAESSEDMTNYIELISKAAGVTAQLRG